MSYEGIIATEAELDAMAGANVATAGWTEANKNLWMLQVEGFLSSLVKYDIATNYGTLEGVSKKLLNEYAARYCALSGIAYNLGTFTTRQEAIMMLNVHAWRMQKIEAMLLEGSILKELGIT